MIHKGKNFHGFNPVAFPFGRILLVDVNCNFLYHIGSTLIIAIVFELDDLF